MADNFGYTFAPTMEAAQQARSKGGAAPQGAIQTLNYRLPRFTGAGISPHQSDTPSGVNQGAAGIGQSMQPAAAGVTAGGGGFGQMVLQSVLRTILGPEQLSSFDSPSQSGGVQAPSIIPGIDKPSAAGMPRLPEGETAAPVLDTSKGMQGVSAWEAYLAKKNAAPQFDTQSFQNFGYSSGMPWQG